MVRFGYVELIYAVQNKIDYGIVENAAGTFVKAVWKRDGSRRFGKEMPADFRVSITNAPGKDAYPISSFTWLLIPEPIQGSGEGKNPGGFPELDGG